MSYMCCGGLSGFLYLYFYFYFFFSSIPTVWAISERNAGLAPAILSRWLGHFFVFLFLYLGYLPSSWQAFYYSSICVGFQAYLDDGVILLVWTTAYIHVKRVYILERPAAWCAKTLL